MRNNHRLESNTTRLKFYEKFKASSPSDMFKIVEQSNVSICKLCDLSIEHAGGRDKSNKQNQHLQLHLKQNSYRKYNNKCEFCNLFIHKTNMSDHLRLYHPLELKKMQVQREVDKIAEKQEYKKFMVKNTLIYIRQD